MARRGSIGDSSDNDFSDAGGGSDTDTGSGVTGDDGADTSFGGSDPDTGDTTDNDSSGTDPSDTGGFDGGGGADDDDSDVTDRDTTYSGGGSSTTAPSGSTGGGTETTFEGGGGDETTTQAPQGETGAADSTQPDEVDDGSDDLPANLADESLEDADRGFSVTRQPTQLDGGQLEQSDRAVEASRTEQPETTQRLDGLEEEYGALSGREGELASQVQQLQGRIDRETELDAFLDTEDYAIRRQGDRLVTEFASGVGRDDPEPTSASERRAQIAEEIAAEREGVAPDDVTVTSTAAGYQAIIGDGSSRTVVTGGPNQERVETEVRVGETDRGVGITSGPSGGSIVLPGSTAADAGRRSQRQPDAQPGPNSGDVRADVTQYGQVQLDRSQVSTGQPPLIESDAGLIEVLDDPSKRRRRRLSIFNDALGTVGLGEELGFREQTQASTEPTPATSDPLRYLRGAGPRRRTRVEREQVGSAVRRRVASDEAQAAALIGVGSPEPVSTVGGALVLGTAGVAAVAGSNQNEDPTTFGRDTGELEVPDEQDRSELSVPEGSQRGELAVPEQQLEDVSELGTPEGRPGTRSELDVPSQESPTPMTIRTAELIGRQRGRQREDEEDDDLGPPDDDPFAISDRRLYDQTRRFGEREDVSDLPTEQTPEEIDDIDEGIAGEGGAIEPARGETVAENFQLFLEEQQARQEEAQRQEVLVDEDTPTRQEDPSAVAEEETTASDQGALERLDQSADRSVAPTIAFLPFPYVERPEGQSEATRPTVGARPGQVSRPQFDQPNVFSPTRPQTEQTPQLNDPTQPTTPAQSTQPQQTTPTTEMPAQSGLAELNPPGFQEVQEPPATATPFTPGFPSFPTRPRDIDDDRDPSRRRDEPSAAADTDVAGSDALAPNWVNQTFQTIALEGRVDEPVPTESDVDEPGAALPAGVEVFGTEDEQDQFENVSAFFSFGGLR